MRAAFYSVGFSWIVSAALGSPVRLTFTRKVPPQHDLSWADRAAIVYAIGDNDKIGSFIDHFIEYAGRGALRVDNAVENNQHLGSFDARAFATIRRDHPADAYIGVSLFSCAGAEKIGDVGETDYSGERVHRRMQWLDAVCTARIDVRKPDGKRMLAFMTHGEGTSPRAKSLTEDERSIAFEQAARFAALNAAESITPRFQRESIELDETAPAFDEAVASIDADRLGDVRAIWEAALSRHHDSAALNFNLGAVAEALGDVRAAEQYFRTASRLAPNDFRYRAELNLLLRRNSTQKKGERRGK